MDQMNNNNSGGMNSGGMNSSGPQQQQQQSSMPPKAPDNQTLMGVLAYLGPLVIISYVTSKDDPFVKFHIKQGLVLLVIEVAVWFVGMALWAIWPLLQVINLGTLVLAILGIINVTKKLEKELPIVGSYAHLFKI
jgi:uncharacterized membrane protein